MKDLPVLLDRLEEAGGPADPVPSADGWQLVLAENIGYLVDDQRRWRAMADLRAEVRLMGSPGQSVLTWQRWHVAGVRRGCRSGGRTVGSAGQQARA